MQGHVKTAEVLVVEDEDDVRRLVRVLLERAGHTVVEAADGLEALRRLEDDAPDLVVLDVAMPELDGWQTLERIRDLSDVPVLMLTARAGELDQVRGLRGGADDYVTKPFGRQELLARVEALLRRTTGPPEVRAAYEDAALRIDYVSREVTVDAGRAGRQPDAARVQAAVGVRPPPERDAQPHAPAGARVGRRRRLRRRPGQALRGLPAPEAGLGAV